MESGHPGMILKNEVVPTVHEYDIMNTIYMIIAANILFAMII